MAPRRQLVLHRAGVTDPVSGREFALTSNSTRSMVFWMVLILTGYFTVMLLSIYLF